MSNTYSKIRQLFGKKIDDAEVQSFLSDFPTIIQKPSDGQQYVLCLKEGFDLLFENPNSKKVPARNDRFLTTVFLYNDGEDKHSVFKDLPYSLNFDLSRKDLLKHMPRPERTWKIGLGEVDIDFDNPSHDRFNIDGLFVSVHYRRDGSQKHVIISNRK